jgi:uncharacterized protein (DUF305 family)
MRAFVPGFIPIVVLAAAAGCGAPVQQPAVIQPGAPGEASRVIASGAGTEQPAPAVTAADVKFMQGMIHHHAQALDMTELIGARTQNPDMKRLGLRIQVSQTDEIKMMQQWLEARGQNVPGRHAHHMPGATPMPGMLTSDEMTRLAGATGTEFERLFLEGMIKHHGGAIVMVQELFATPGAGQQSDVFAFASDVEADQKMEIDRMGAMLKERMK